MNQLKLLGLIDEAMSFLEEEEEHRGPFEDGIVPVADVEQVIRKLAPFCKAPADIRRLCFYGEQQERTRSFLRIAVEVMNSKQRDLFEQHCLQLSQNDWRTFGIEPDDVLVALFSQGIAEASIARLRRWSDILDTFPRAESVDIFWTIRVRTHIAKKDWKRAWDDLRHALIGFPEDETALSQYRELRYSWENKKVLDDRSLYCQKQETRAQLVRDVFNAMVAASLLENLVEADQLLASPMTSVESVRISKREKGLVRLKQEVLLPGFLEATLFILDSDFRLKGGSYGYSIRLAPEGAMVLKIASYACRKKNAARQQKIADKVADFERRTQSKQ